MATAAEVQTLTKELQKLKDDRKAETDELVQLREEFRVGFRVKDLSAANFIKVWKGEPFGYL